jgi:hypothetical protein
MIHSQRFAGIRGIRERLRSDYRWLRVRRVQHEGLASAVRRRRAITAILRTAPVDEQRCGAGGGVEIHLLCWDGDYLAAIWALKTFYRFVPDPIPLVIHYQGQISRRARRLLRYHFPFARLIDQCEADRSVEEILTRRHWKRLLIARRQSVFMYKLTDFLLMARAPRIMLMDSDVLFFASPGALFSEIERKRPTVTFMRDPVSVYNLSIHEAHARLGIEMAPQVNTGLGVIDRELIDLTRCECFLEDVQIARPTGFIEQTLYALAASEQARVKFLPDEYLVSLQPGIDCSTIIARHYAGPSRPLMVEEGMAYLSASGWLRATRQ